MQTSAFQSLHLNAVYLPFPISEEQLPDLLNAFKLIGLQGFNVTIPYKERIIPYLSQLSEDARRLGSVNTVKAIDGRWKGYSTDGPGFMRSLSSRKLELHQKKVLMLGAGGAAKAIAFALINQGLDRLDIKNRTREKAQSLKEKLEVFAPELRISVNPETKTEYDLLINTSAVGMDGVSLPIELEVLDRCAFVADIIYNPPSTPLLQAAQKRGIPCDNGLEMLLFQGVESFEIWTGQEAPVAVMRDSLKKSLAFTN